jgi:hypothetical protein
MTNRSGAILGARARVNVLLLNLELDGSDRLMAEPEIRHE